MIRPATLPAALVATSFLALAFTPAAAQDAPSDAAAVTAALTDRMDVLMEQTEARIADRINADSSAFAASSTDIDSAYAVRSVFPDRLTEDDGDQLAPVYYAEGQ